MQRLCYKFRSLGLQSAQAVQSLSRSRRLLHFFPQLHQPLNCTSRSWSFKPIVNASSSMIPFIGANTIRSPPFFVSCAMFPQGSVGRREPMTPITSKLKKTKIKFFSSYKSTFRTMKDGNIRRWREGKRHNAHSKSKEAKRRLRRPSTVPLAYAKVMKKLNFFG